MAMQRSSASIGNLAAALAKAQEQLINPEKSMVGTIRRDGLGKGEQIFRYAPLSSGLDIVRKTLGQQEIATVQTTAVDQTAGLVNLTTMLAHSSGEWIASDWPVCEIADMATPQRMGAALTYARRYALFTLVGIAGEDDLDAPDLAMPTMQASRKEKQIRREHGRLNGSGKYPAPRAAPRHKDEKNRLRSTRHMHVPEIAAELRDRLLAELNELGCANDAASWAQRCLPEKNKLAAADAKRVEEAFTAKLTSFVVSVADTSDATEKSEQPPTSHGPDSDGLEWSPSKLIDKSALAWPEPRRLRDRNHVRFVADQPCLICARRPSDAHHLRFAQSRALGRKVSDEFTVPMCRGHHREVHRSGDEAAWWRRTGTDPSVAARALWLDTHPLSP
jgi:ERF superfamily